MPHKMWKHFCLTSNCEITCGAQIFASCDEEGSYNGSWYSSIEAMGRIKIFSA
jgi:hypothetical protein